ncbi:MAG: hypothetical protein QOJ72_1810 [Nocardioidaceae bacterium]|jgi:hypothetical protein|nr:hypothetical protein [Nocardioidaceae bacterium]
MRQLTAGVCVLIAVVAALITVPMAWVATHVADEDGYVSFSKPLGSDHELQRAFSAYLSDQLVTKYNLPAVVRPQASAALTVAARTASNAPGYTQAWEETQRRSHRLVFGPDAKQDRLAIDVGPLATFALKHVGTNLPVTLPTINGSLVVAVNGAPESGTINQVKHTPERSRIGLIVIAVAVAGALIFARRRSVVLVWLGVGAVAVAGVLRLVSSRLAPGILDHTPAPSSFARTLQKLLADRAADSLGTWLLWIAIGGAVAIVAGLLSRVASTSNARA